MYTVAKGPTHILQKSRRGLTNLEANVEAQKGGSPSPPPDQETLKQETRLPQLVFHAPQEKRGSRRRAESKRDNQNKFMQEERALLQIEEHKELVSFLSQTWGQIRKEIEAEDGVVRYLQETDNPDLLDFEPFDLDEWMEQKIFNAVMSGV